MCQGKKGEEDLPALKRAMKTIQRVEDYIEKHGGRLIKATKNNIDNNKEQQNRNNQKRRKWKGKQLYGRFKRLKNDILHEKTWT